MILDWTQRYNETAIAINFKTHIVDLLVTYCEAKVPSLPDNI